MTFGPPGLDKKRAAHLRSLGALSDLHNNEGHLTLRLSTCDDLYGMTDNNANVTTTGPGGIMTISCLGASQQRIIFKSIPIVGQDGKLSI